MNSVQGQSKLIFGMHEKCPLDVMPDGTVLYIAEVGDSDEPHLGIDLSDEPRAVIVRIQWLFGEHGGCYPPPRLRRGFLQRVGSMVRNTPDCHIWQGGNEPNIKTEGLFSPEDTAHNYNGIRETVHLQPGHENDQALLPPIGPWNIEIGYGWIEYFVRLIGLCQGIDGFALHCYSRGPDPASITSEQKMDPPYQHLYSGFRTYRDWMAAIPRQYRDRPAYITEADENEAWLNKPNTWIQEAYREIDSWNQDPDNQAIRALILYRWPKHDQYNIEGKGHVIRDFQLAQSHDYTWTDDPDPPEPPGDETMKNPSFELPYVAHAGTVQVARDWQPFWYTGDPPQETSQGPCMMPEFKPLPRALDPRRVVEGDTAQCWFIRYKVMDGGVYQVVPVTEGSRYEFDASLQAWCTDSNDPTVSDGEMYCSLGISPTGGTNAFELGIQWTSWQWMNAEHRRFESLEVQAGAPQITLFIRVWNKWRLSHNDAYADDVHLVQVDKPIPPDPPDPPTEPVECNALTADEIRQIVREEIDKTRLST